MTPPAPPPPSSPPSTAAEAKVAEVRTELTRARLSDRVAIAGSAFVAALGLAVSTYNVYLQRAQIRAQVWPNVECRRNDVDGFHVELRNSGVGPARLIGARVTLDGVPYTKWDDILAAVSRDVPGPWEPRRNQASFVGSVLTPGETTPVFSVVLPEDDGAHRRAVTEKLWGIQCIVCYCSTLDECWMTGKGGATPVKACPMESLSWAW
jgi:hypothetical protein